MKLSSPEFKQGDMISRKFTCDGENINPPLEIDDVPERTKTLALIVDDPDAPDGTFVHWVLFNIAPLEKIAEDSSPGMEGSNDFGNIGYGGPCPPSGIHRYYFKLYALDSEVSLEAGGTKDDLLEAMQDHVLAEAELMGRYRREQ